MCQVSTRAECSTSTGHHDDSYIGVGLGLTKSFEVRDLHVAGHAVHGIGSIKRQGGDAIGDVVQTQVFSHARTLRAVPCHGPDDETVC